jgi:hypothetical protein
MPVDLEKVRKIAKELKGMTLRTEFEWS